MVLPVLVCAQSISTGKKNTNTQPYPLGNPIVTHMYTADAAPHVFPDGNVWMVTSVDSENGGGYETMHSYHTFSSSDMKTWTDHGEILHIRDVQPANTPNEKWALWAPDMVYQHGKYYLYFPIRVLYTDSTGAKGNRVTKSWIGVAVSDAPDKPFTVVNPHIEGTAGIDPSVFIDDDGTPYLYWGQHMAAILKDNMTELATRPVKLDVGTDRFMEAVWMNKHNGEYYLSYHTKYDWQVKITGKNTEDPNRAKSELAYSVGKSPLGPFVYKGVLNPELGVGVQNGPRSPEGDFVPWRLTQSNHGGIVEFHGQEYLFYHTSALSSWRQDAFKGEGSWTQRSVCVDKLNYTASGGLIPVQQTVEGVPAVKVEQPYAILLTGKKAQASSATVSKGSVQVTGKKALMHYPAIKLGSGYYYFRLATKATTPARVEIRLDHADGELIGTVVIQPGTVANNVYSTLLRGAHGTHSIYLVISREDTTPLILKDLQFIAGAPVGKHE